MVGYIINLEDSGQDFTSVIVDRDGKIIETRPFNKDFMKDGYVPIDDPTLFQLGKTLPIHCPPYINFGFLKYKVESVVKTRL